MAINRFEQPANPARRQPYVSQFVETPYVGLPLEQLDITTKGLQNQADKTQQAQDQLKGLAKAIKVADLSPDIETRDRLHRELQSQIEGLSTQYSRGLADRRYMSEISNMANQLGSNPDVQTLMQNREYNEQYQKALLQAKQNGKYHPLLDEYNLARQQYNQAGRLGSLPFGGLPEQLDWRKQQEEYFNNIHADSSGGGNSTIQGDFIVHSTGRSEAISSSKVANQAYRSIGDYANTSEGRQDMTVFRRQMEMNNMDPNEYESSYKTPDGKKLKGLQGYLYDQLVGTGLERVYTKTESDNTLSVLPEHFGGSGGRLTRSTATGMEAAGKKLLNINLNNNDPTTNVALSTYFSSTEGRNKFKQVAELFKEKGVKRKDGSPVDENDVYNIYMATRRGADINSNYTLATEQSIGDVLTGNWFTGNILPSTLIKKAVEEVGIPEHFQEVLGQTTHNWTIDTGSAGLGKKFAQEVRATLGSDYDILDVNGQPYDRAKIQKISEQLSDNPNEYSLLTLGAGNHYWTTKGKDGIVYYIKPKGQVDMDQFASHFYNEIRNSDNVTEEQRNQAQINFNSLNSLYEDPTALQFESQFTNIKNTPYRIGLINNKYRVLQGDGFLTVPIGDFNSEQEAINRLNEINQQSLSQ